MNLIHGLYRPWGRRIKHDWASSTFNSPTSSDSIRTCFNHRLQKTASAQLSWGQLSILVRPRVAVVTGIGGKNLATITPPWEEQEALLKGERLDKHPPKMAIPLKLICPSEHRVQNRCPNPEITAMYAEDNHALHRTSSLPLMTGLSHTTVSPWVWSLHLLPIATLTNYYKFSGLGPLKQMYPLTPLEVRSLK